MLRRRKRNFRTRFCSQLLTLLSGLGFPVLPMQRVQVRCSEKAFKADKSIRQFSRGKREGAQTNGFHEVTRLLKSPKPPMSLADLLKQKASGLHGTTI